MANVALKNIIETPMAANIRESANRIWLAGLGAFAKTQEEGEKLFQSLIEEGEKVEKNAKKAAEDRLEEAKGKVIEFRNEEIEAIQEVIAKRLGYRLVDHRLELYAVPLKSGDK